MLTIVALQEEGTCQILQLRRMERRGGAESLCLRVELVLARLGIQSVRGVSLRLVGALVCVIDGSRNDTQ